MKPELSSTFLNFKIKRNLISGKKVAVHCTICLVSKKKHGLFMLPYVYCSLRAGLRSKTASAPVQGPRGAVLPEVTVCLGYECVPGSNIHCSHLLQNT